MNSVRYVTGTVTYQFYIERFKKASYIVCEHEEKSHLLSFAKVHSELHGFCDYSGAVITRKSHRVRFTPCPKSEKLDPYHKL
jgi:hypothetical protein